MKTCQPVIDFANPCTYCKREDTKQKGISLSVVRQHQLLKYVNNVSCVDLSSVNLVPNFQTVASDLPVGARLHQLWKAWEALEADPKVLKILKIGYTLSFQIRPNLTRSPAFNTGYSRLYFVLNFQGNVFQ